MEKLLSIVLLLAAVSCAAARELKQQPPSSLIVSPDSLTPVEVAEPAFKEGEVLVGYDDDRVPDVASDPPGLRRKAAVGSTGKVMLYKIEENGKSVNQKIRELKRRPGVRYAEPNYIITKLAAPNDPQYGQQYGYAKVSAPAVWDRFTGASDFVIGVIDTGIDNNHPDLKDNLAAEQLYANASGMTTFFDGNGHGTHCAGTIGATSNNAGGVAGMNWNIKIMACKFLGDDGTGSTDGAIECLRQMRVRNVTITSNSWGGAGSSTALRDEIVAYNNAGGLFVAAAGNDGKNTDSSANFPSNYDVPNVISVAATDINDARPSWSNYGQTTVDLGAPGVNILSTFPGDSYGAISGTSMATPHVAGGAALLAGFAKNVHNITLTPAELKCLLMKNVDYVTSMMSVTVSEGRMNISRSLEDFLACSPVNGCLLPANKPQQCGPAPAPSVKPAAPSTQQCTVTLYTERSYRGTAVTYTIPVWQVQAVGICYGVKAMPVSGSTSFSNNVESLRIRCTCTGGRCNTADAVGSGQRPYVTAFDAIGYLTVLATYPTSCSSTSSSSTCSTDVWTLGTANNKMDSWLLCYGGGN